MPNSSTIHSTPIALTIAGSDSSGGAGIQADLKAFSALGVYGASAITAITAQNTHAVTAVLTTPTAVIEAQIQAVLSDLDVNAIKIGMLSTSEIIQVVADELAAVSLPIVLDPVMVAKSGDQLLQQDAIESLRKYLLPKATLVTPNIPEAATLLDCEQASSEGAMVDQAQELIKLGAQAVLMKGGHAKGMQCVDILMQQDGTLLRLVSERVDTQNTHGTGCTLSASITAELAKGHQLVESTQVAHAYLAKAIIAADTLHIGSGHGPVHHFHELW